MGGVLGRWSLGDAVVWLDREMYVVEEGFFFNLDLECVIAFGAFQWRLDACAGYMGACACRCYERASWEGTSLSLLYDCKD